MSELVQEEKQIQGSFVKTKKRVDWLDEVKGYDLPEPLAAKVKEYEDRALDAKPTDEMLERTQERFEKNAESVKDYRLPDDHLIREEEVARKGRLIHHLKFLEILRKAGIKCWYNTEPFRGLIGLRAVVPGRERLGIQFICAVKMGWTWEFDKFNYDAYGNPLNKAQIGWRSVVIMLISKGVLTEQKAHKLFGSPIPNRASELYRRTLWQIRNSRARGEEVEVHL